MFEELVRGPEPWLYAHVMLPGGAENLGNPDYDLADEASRAPRDGTLMRVRSFERLPDNRLAIVARRAEFGRIDAVDASAPRP